MSDEREDFEPEADLKASLHNFVSQANAPEEPKEEEEAPPSLTDEFPEEMYQELMGLMWVGYLEKSFDFARHHFVIRTITVGEELAVAQVVKEYHETLGQAKAYAAGLVAACIISVDGQDLISRLGPSTLASTRDKFEFIIDDKEGWYWPTVEAVFNHYSELQLRQAAVYERLESKSLASRP